MSFVLFATLAFYVFQSMYLLRLLLAGESVRSILGILTDGLLFVGIVYGLGRRIQSQLDVDSILRALSIASALFLACNIIQLGFGYGQAIGQGRFMGVSGNPQLAGFVSAVFVIVNCYSHSRSSFKSWMSYYHAIQIGLLLMLIVWSGSRMSALSVAVGLMFFYRLRIGKILVFGIVSGIVLFIAVSFFPDSLTKVDLQAESIHVLLCGLLESMISSQTHSSEQSAPNKMIKKSMRANRVTCRPLHSWELLDSSCLRSRFFQW